jgi:hypothetical protein
MTKDDILRALDLFGFSKLEVGLEQPDHANGPAFCVCATRERSEGAGAGRSELVPAPAPRAEATGPEAVAESESDPAGVASARTPIPVPVHRPISYVVRCPVAALREVEVAIGSFGNISVEGSVELEVRDDVTDTLLRRSTVSFQDLRGWRIFSFEFDVVEGLNGKALRLTFEPRTDHPVALLELSRRCLSLRRRLLRKLSLDRTGDHLRCVLR